MRASVAAITVMIAAAGCGRFNFDGVDRGDAGSSDDSTDSANSDGPSNLVEVIDEMRLPVGIGNAFDFGGEIAMSGDGTRIVAGMPQSVSVEGRALVYALTATGWEVEADLLPGDLDTDLYGESVAINGDGSVIIVGAPWDDGIPGDPDTNASPDSGAAWVWKRTGTAWSVAAYLKNSSQSDFDEFGDSVAISEDGLYFAVGAPREDSAATGLGGIRIDETATDAGAAFVYFDNQAIGMVEEIAYVKASNTDANDRFGTTVALSRDANVLAVGAPEEASNAIGINGNQANNAAGIAGAVYIYSPKAPGSFVAYLKASNTDTGDGFGSTLAISASGTRLIVGANGEDGGGQGVGSAPDEGANGAGAAYVLEDDGGWSHVAYVKAMNAAMSDSFSLSVAISADGSTVLAGATGEDGSQTGRNPASDDLQMDAGAAYTFGRDAGGTWSDGNYLKAAATIEGGICGRSSALSADGSVIAIGCPNDGAGGAIYVFRSAPE